MSVTPGTQVSLRLDVGRLNDVSFSAVTRLVAKYPPFSGYSFGLMAAKIQDQLLHGSNVLAILDNKLVAYAGWIVADRAETESWLEHGGSVPDPRWQTGDACIITIVVTDHRAYLMPMFRAVSHVCAGKKGYRMRSFNDGRQDSRRPLTSGRRQSFSADPQ